MATEKKERLIFIDVLRGIAVIWMIQTHTLSIMATEFKTGLFYSLLSISNGYVAVTFLFCAGAGFWIAAERKVSSYKKFEMPLWLYLKRLGFILMIAYFLHSPIFGLSKLTNITERQINIFFQIDVLQTIVYSSLLALLLLLLSPKNIYFKYMSIILAAVFFIGAQFTWYSNPFDYLPHFFAFFLAAPPISKFPLLPWSGYFFAGIAFTAFFMDSKNREKFSMYFIIIGILTPTILFALKDFGVDYIKSGLFLYANPTHSIFRVSAPVLAFSALYLLEKYYRNFKITNLLVVSGRESLYLYVSHLLIVYGSVLNMGIKYFGINNVTPLTTTFVIFAIILLCVSTAYIWHNLKNKYPEKSKYIIYANLLILMIFFLIN